MGKECWKSGKKELYLRDGPGQRYAGRRGVCIVSPARPGAKLSSKGEREGGRGAGADGYVTARLPDWVRLALLRLPPSRRPRRPRRPRRFQLRRRRKLRRRAEGGGRPPVELGRSGRRCSGQVVAAEAKSRRGDESARPEAHARAPSASREAPDRITRWGPLVAFVLSAPPRWGWRAQCAPLPLRMSA